MTHDSARIDFVCIGAQRCATTRLHDVLLTHPEVAMPRIDVADWLDNVDGYA